MFNPAEQFESFVKQVSSNFPFPQGAVELQKDFEKNLRVAMENAFRRMNLITREEFDVQAGVLARTREKLEALETRLEALEASILAAQTAATQVVQAPVATVVDAPVVSSPATDNTSAANS